MYKIQPSNISEPKGHYSPAVVHNGLIFVSGQMAIDYETGKAKTETVEEQTIQCMKNVELILNAAGSGKEHLIKVTIYVSDEKFWIPVNEAYKAFMGSYRPARAIIPVGSFRDEFLIEIEAIAAVAER
ncbi:MAG: RidA family protein [Pyrinomonadaceae bacterium]